MYPRTPLEHGQARHNRVPAVLPELGPTQHPRTGDGLPPAAATATATATATAYTAAAANVEHVSAAAKGRGKLARAELQRQS